MNLALLLPSLLYESISTVKELHIWREKRLIEIRKKSILNIWKKFRIFKLSIN